MAALRAPCPPDLTHLRDRQLDHTPSEFCDMLRALRAARTAEEAKATLSTKLHLMERTIQHVAQGDGDRMLQEFPHNILLTVRPNAPHHAAPFTSTNSWLLYWGTDETKLIPPELLLVLKQFNAQGHTMPTLHHDIARTLVPTAYTGVSRGAPLPSTPPPLPFVPLNLLINPQHHSLPSTCLLYTSPSPRDS